MAGSSQRSADALNAVALSGRPLLVMTIALLSALSLHIGYLSPGFYAAAVMILGWRWAVYRGHLSFPGKIVKLLAVILAVVGVIQATGLKVSLEASTSFLVAAGLLKVLELATRRDGTVLTFLIFFLIATGFLYQQDILATLRGVTALVLAVMGMVMVQSTLRHGSSQAPVGRVSASLLLATLPFMLVLYFLFPRLGPLWSVATQSDSAMTGLSPVMEPGKVTELSQSSQLAFRVTFEGAKPPQRELYWRAMTMDRFDGQAWHQSEQDELDGVVAPVIEKELYRYQVMLEPTGERYLPALVGTRPLGNRPSNTVIGRDFESGAPVYNNAPVYNSATASNNGAVADNREQSMTSAPVLIRDASGNLIEQGGRLNGSAYSRRVGSQELSSQGISNPRVSSRANGQMVTATGLLYNDKPVYQKIAYEGVSGQPLVYGMPGYDRSLRTVPGNSNPETMRWARQLSGDVTTFIRQFEGMIRQQAFHYTLRPPRYGKDGIDDFLFSQRRGFCEHYASAMAFAARVAGIPSRVVTGYQGGEWHPEGYLSVRQYDAHAWVELWDGVQWRRTDPTAAIAPERIEQGLREAVADEGSFLESSFASPHRYRDIGWLNAIRFEFENANYLWSRWVLSFDGKSQSQLLKRWFGLDDMILALYWLAGAIGLIFILASVVLWWQQRAPWQDPVAREWQAFIAKAQALGFAVHTGMAPAQAFSVCLNSGGVGNSDARAISGAGADRQDILPGELTTRVITLMNQVLYQADRPKAQEQRQLVRAIRQCRRRLRRTASAA
ncbi:MAG: transglutaminaseTgpA domain-containing protein [Pseudomonadota bacterium]|nr:transglutaminaseTgpA domain-containing protein [Pseudomonadota bacterium]